jgi:tryptophan-rich sensory protein
MKNSKLLLLIATIIAYTSPLLVFIVFNEKPFFEPFVGFVGGFISVAIVAYFKDLIFVFKNLRKVENPDFEQLNLKIRIVWSIFYLLTSGLLLYYSFNYTPNLGYNNFFILFGIFLMIQGNYQSVLRHEGELKDRFGANHNDAYGDIFYKKSQKLIGKFEFYFGLSVVIVFIVLPNIIQVAVGGVFGILIFYYLGSWIFIYKNTQIIAESEAKTK